MPRRVATMLAALVEGDRSVGVGRDLAPPAVAREPVGVALRNAIDRGEALGAPGGHGDWTSFSVSSRCHL